MSLPELNNRIRRCRLRESTALPLNLFLQNSKQSNSFDFSVMMNTSFLDVNLSRKASVYWEPSGYSANFLDLSRCIIFIGRPVGRKEEVIGAWRAFAGSHCTVLVI